MELCPFLLALNVLRHLAASLPSSQVLNAGLERLQMQMNFEIICAPYIRLPLLYNLHISKVGKDTECLLSKSAFKSPPSEMQP